jgi:hypothetical protein
MNGCYLQGMKIYALADDMSGDCISLRKCSRSSMDRIADSGSVDGGSNPFGNTLISNKALLMITLKGLLLLTSFGAF